MKKYFYILAALSIAPTFAIAQSVESDVDAELDQMYSGASSTQAASPTTAPSAGIANSAPVSGQPIYILNQATPTSNANANAQLQQSQVQKQPTTVIEASPLTESRAEQIRRSRQDAETATEQRIVEKLEQSRMEDERKRANVLFGDKFDNMNNQQQQQQVVPVPVQQVQPIIVQQVPAPVQKVEEPKENTRDIVREEITAALKAEDEAAVDTVEQKYIAGLLGIGDYPDAKQVKGNYALGVAVGTKFDNFVVEGSFLYSNYTVEGQGYMAGQSNPYGYGYGYGYGGGYAYNNGTVFVPDTVDVRQYSGSLAAKVQLFSGVIKPVFGGVVAYSYRQYSWNNITGIQNDTTASSHAIDVGTLVGADLEFSPKYAIGLDFRYMWNLSSRINSGNTWMSGSSYGTPIEKLQYYVMSIAGKVNF